MARNSDQYSNIPWIQWRQYSGSGLRASRSGTARGPTRHPWLARLWILGRKTVR